MRFRPDDLAGLALWLRADQGVYQDTGKTTPATQDGQPVAAWAHVVSQNVHVAQSTAAKRPTLRTGVLNGHPVVRFDGADDELIGNASITPRTVFAVVKMNAENVCVLGRSGSNFYGWFTQFAGNPSQLQIRDGSGTPAEDLSTVYAVGQWDILAGTMAGSGATSALHVNGERRDTSTLQAPSGGTLILGARQNPNSRLFLNGDVAELIVYERLMSWAEIRAIELYLAERYGIALTLPDIVVNDADLTTSYGFYLSRPDGYLETPPREYDRVQLAGIPGVRLLNERVGSRQVAAIGFIDAGSTGATRENLLRLKWLLRRRQPNEIIFRDQPLRLLGQFLRMDPDPADPAFVQADMDARIVWEVANPPYWLGLASRTVSGIGGTPVQLPMGTERPWNVEVVVQGPATGPVRLIFADYLGNDVHEVQVDVDLAATPEYLVIEMGPGRISAYQNTSGLPRDGTDVLDLWVSGPGDIFVPFDPAWWDYDTERWMTVRCLSGTARMTYDPAFE